MTNLNPKRTKRCNQSSVVGSLKGTTPRHRPSVKLKLPKGEYSALTNMANLYPKRMKRCNQSSLVGTLNGTTPRHRSSRYTAFGKSFKWTTFDTVLQGMQPSARNLSERPPDTVLLVSSGRLTLFARWGLFEREEK